LPEINIGQGRVRRIPSDMKICRQIVEKSKTARFLNIVMLRLVFLHVPFEPLDVVEQSTLNIFFLQH